ncbi:MAG: hypothetical protein WCP21_04620 [Armatimonadota bacterium]
MTDIDRDDDDEELDPEALFAGHKQTGEPLGGHELDAILAAHLATRDAFDMRGGDLWWESAIFPDPDSDDTLPVVQAGESCPACGGRIVVDGACRYTRVPIYADGTPTDEGDGGDFEWDEKGPYCADCGERVTVE